MLYPPLNPPDTRCPLCPGINKCLKAEGPRQCSYFFIGEAPGPVEEKKGQIFAHSTGQELTQQYFPLAGLERPKVRLTNAMRCFPVSTGGKLDPKREKDLELLQSCAEHHLYPDLEATRPTLIIPMGAFACRAIDPEINLDLHHGIALSTKWGTVFPMFHPAGGIHEPKKMLLIRTDWARLGKYLQGRLKQPVDEFEGKTDYRHVKGRYGVMETLIGREMHDMAGDTEITRDRDPFCLTYSTQPGTGYLIKADDEEALDAFQEMLGIWQGLIWFHNWMFDQAVVKMMRLVFPVKKMRDTMVKAYHLGNLPQGLKALAYRELGMTMQDFDDLVLPHSIPKVLAYYRDAATEHWEKPDPQMVRDSKTGDWKVYKPQSFNTKLKRFFTDYDKAQTMGVYKDPIAMWEDAWEDQHKMVEERMGRWPGKCISYAPFEQVIGYACRDSDSTLRLSIVLKKMQTKVRKTSQENWSDYEVPHNNMPLGRHAYSRPTAASHQLNWGT